MVLENIVVAFGDREVLAASTIRVEPTGVTVLLGRNGTGKSCAFKAIYGLYEQRDLIISFDGRVLRAPYTLPGLINYVPQEHCHPGWLTPDRMLELYGVDKDAFRAKYPMFAGMYTGQTSQYVVWHDAPPGGVGCPERRRPVHRPGRALLQHHARTQ
ncbi:ATP-binding cassette domain-containing protein [Neolewinella antarctica]|uniref:ABC transporter domain-containing protein n=1 Tax=Neolewinella antarctica TaxID=442734 RepID=A0ABX0XE16_9BACT|nr:hypothetical protein [Neolewinella antarctica]